VTTLRPDELGAHMSIAGGLHLALERGQRSAASPCRSS
jgi:hypothetical protein